MMRRRLPGFTGACLSLFVVAGVAAGAETIGEQEPNDRPAEAQAVPFPAFVAGSIGEDRNHSDRFRFSLPPSGLGAVYIHLDQSGPRDLGLRLTDSTGVIRTQSDYFAAGADEYLTSLRPPAGDYGLEVYAKHLGGPEPSTYRLSIGHLPESSPDAVRVALSRALDHLVASQAEDGGMPARISPTAVTALALQGLLGAKYLQRDDWDAIYRAVDYLSARFHDPAGITNPRRAALVGGALVGNEAHIGYEHPIALTALIEANACGIDEGLPRIIDVGLGFSLRAQVSEDRPAPLPAVAPDSIYFGGWRYSAGAKDADLSVTGWEIIALIAGQKAGRQIPSQSLTRALAFVEGCWIHGREAFAYRPAGRIGAARSAMGALSMQLLGDGADPKVALALDDILAQAPTWEGESAGGYPFYYWYYGTRAARLAGGETWDLWRRTTCGMLVRHQRGDGSWDANQSELRKGDSLYVTSLGALILELCDGALPIYMHAGAAPPRPEPPPRNEIQVAITAPAPDALVAGETPIVAEPRVPQRVSVARLLFSVDGEPRCEQTAPPWVCTTDLGAGDRPYSIRVLAENDLGGSAEAELTTRARHNRIEVRIREPRNGALVLGPARIRVSAEDHPESGLERLVVLVDGREVHAGSERHAEVEVDLGGAGGSLIEARAVNILGSEASARVRTREAPPLEVNLVATVTDADDRHVPDLTKADFVLLEDGVEQAITRFARDTTPVSVAILLDTSGSMRRHLRAVQQAARAFVAQVRPVDRVMILTFADRVGLAEGFTSDQGRLDKAIGAIRARGGTALYDAVVAAVGHLKREKGRTAIVLLTDGKDEDNSGKHPGSRHDLGQALGTAAEAGVTIYSLGLGKGVARAPLEQLAERNGGRAYFPPTVKDLEEVYGHIAEALRSRYSLGYSSTDRRRDRRWRGLELSVPGRDCEVRTIDGFRAE